MKKIFYMLMVAAFTFVSCNDEKEVATPLEIEEAMVAFEAGGGEGFVKLSESRIKATSAEDWCEASVFFNEITVRVAPNEDKMARHSRLTITNDSETIHVTVTQQGVNMAFDTTPLSFTAAAESKDINVDAPDGIAVQADSDQTWVTPQVSGKKVTVTVENNAGVASRSATLTIGVGDLERTVSVTQEGMSIVLTPASLSLSAEGESQDITVTSLPEGMPITVTATSNQSWATTSVNGNKVTVTVPATPSINNRTATITVRSGEAQKTATITQLGKTLTADDVYGAYTVICKSYFNGTLSYANVTIRQKTENTVTITGILHSAAYYDATLNLTTRTISCPDLTLVNGINASGNLIYVASMSGDPIVINVVDVGQLSTPVPTAQGQWWGFYVNTTGNWVDLYNGGTTWTRTAL